MKGNMGWETKLGLVFICAAVVVVGFGVATLTSPPVLNSDIVNETCVVVEEVTNVHEHTHVTEVHNHTTVVVNNPVSEFRELEEDVRMAHYNIGDYKLHDFDCTNMAALMEVWLSNKGWDARIQVLTGSGIVGHAVVAVYGNESYIIECTAKRISPAMADKYTLEGEYDNIVDAAEDSRWGPSEWGLALYLQERDN
ncbi:MAG: hypothetical protein ACNYVW_00430 [Methanosarcinales archaeon]